MDALARRTQQITEGSILLALLRLAGPAVVSITLQGAYQLVNAFWVGRLGPTEMAAIAITQPLFSFLLVLGSGLSIAGSIFVAQYSGARQPREVNRVAAQTLLMVVCVSLAFAALGLLCANSVLRAAGVAPDVFPHASAYLHTSYLGLVFSFGFMMFQSILQGTGEARFPLYVVASSVLLNAVLDPLLIFGWGPIPALGVRGAAIATVISQACAAAVGMSALLTGRFGVRLRAADFKPDFAFIKRALAVGLPASIEQSTRTFASVLLTVLAASFGTTALAAYGVATRIIVIFFVPGIALSAATATVVGQNIGAGKIARAERAAQLSGWLAFIALTSLGLLFFPFGEAVSRFIVPTDEDVVDLATGFVHVCAPAFGVMAAQQALAGALRGAGQTMTAMTISLLMQWGAQLPISYYLAKHTVLGFTGLWWGFPVANSLALLGTLLWLRRGTWVRKKLTEEQRLTARVAEAAEVGDATQ